MCSLSDGLGCPAQGGLLEAREGGADRVGADGLDRCCDGPLGSCGDGKRGEELRCVGIEDVVVDRDLGEAEVDQPRFAIRLDEHVGPSEIAMGNPMRPQDRHLLPDSPHQLVGDLVTLEPVERHAVDHLVGEQHRVGADIDDAAQPWRPNRFIAGHQRHQGFVLDGSPQRREGAIVADVFQSEEPVHPEQQVGRALLGAEHLDEQPGAVGEGREVGRRAACIDLGRVHLLDRQSGVGECCTDRGQRRPSIRTTEREQDRGATRCAERECDEHVRGEAS